MSTFTIPTNGNAGRNMPVNRIRNLIRRLNKQARTLKDAG